MTKSRPIEKQDFLNRLYDTFANLAVFLTVVAFIVAVAPLIYVGFVFAYVMIAFILSVFLIIFTLGLIFTVENNIVVRIWSSMDKLDVDKASNFQLAVGPTILGILGVLLVLLIVGFIFKMNKTKTKPIVVIILGSIAFLLLLVFVIVGGSAK